MVFVCRGLNHSSQIHAYSFCPLNDPFKAMYILFLFILVKEKKSEDILGPIELLT